jgi:hypothetical protein
MISYKKKNSHITNTPPPAAAIQLLKEEVAVNKHQQPDKARDKK